MQIKILNPFLLNQGEHMKTLLAAMTASPAAAIIISVALMLISGFLMTRLTKLVSIPDVTAYILAGILIGPYGLNLVPQSFISGSDFLADIALAFIAFSVGEFFRFSVMKQNGMKVVVITIFEACFASFCIFVVMFYFLHLQFAFSILLAALAAATAPASTIMTIRQTHAGGDFVNTLLQVVALDDVVGLVEYSVAISVALVSLNGSGKVESSQIITPILINLGVLLLGCLFGFVLKLMLPESRRTDNRLIIAIAVLFAFCGICAMLDVSPLLGCMSMAMVYINITDDSKLFRQLNYFSPPILLLFFVRSGMSFRLDALTSSGHMVGTVPLLTVGIIYFIFRILGKYAGAWIGCALTGKSRKVRDCLGLALIPQAGVAIGLAALCARTVGGEAGMELETIILASSVLYELIGPGCGKLALYLTGSYAKSAEDAAAAPSAQPQPENADQLALRVQEIQKSLAGSEVNEDEEAFNEAAMEQEFLRPPYRHGRFVNNR
jgi:Kef-type K+ transport system membrane component KefB